jgi:membrane-associated protease RseP (regulator of RpoE activity)
MYLYRTKLGIKFIEKFSKKYEKGLRAIIPLVLFVGYALMITMFYLLYQTVKIYVTRPDITNVISAPPIMPLIPYFPQIFHVESLMPPFYFTYFLLALMIVAAVHEFSHGIYMKLFKIKIKSTGFAFLGPILGAFVEEDKKGFGKKKNKDQMTVLAAGVFANFLFGLIFFGLLVLFFSLSYVPSGYNFNVYIASNSSQNLLDDLNSSAYNLSTAELANLSVFYDEQSLQLNNLGVVKEINGGEIKKYSDMRESLTGLNSGKIIDVKIEINGKLKDYNMTVSQHPYNSSQVSLGFGNLQAPQETVKQKILGFFVAYKDPTTNYQQKFESADFFYNLFWWIMVINFLVALFNMLPIGILDGGKFFHLTIVSLTGSEKVANKFFKIIGWIIFIMFLLMMFYWLIGLIF